MAQPPIVLTVGIQGRYTFGDRVDDEGELALYNVDGDVDWLTRTHAREIVDHLTALFGLTSEGKR